MDARPLYSLGSENRLNLQNYYPKVRILLDIGHLNVSSTTIGYSGTNLIKEIKDKIMALHLSHNNGLIDSNNSLEETTSYLQEVKKIPCKYSTLEVYDYNPSILRNCVKLAESS